MANGRYDAFDVLIVGGGPAGCAAAIVCRTRGMRTGLVTRQRAHFQQPGETLHPGIEPLFEQIGVDGDVTRAAGMRHRGYIAHTAKASSIIEYGQDSRGVWHGYQISREALDDILLARTEAVGATILRCPATAVPVVEKGTVVGLELGSQVVRSRWVIDATGSSAWLRRSLGLRQVRITPPLVARYGWTDTDQELAPDVLPQFTETQFGWRWLAPVTSRKLAWVSLPLRGLRAEPELAGYSGMDVTWRITLDCAGQGYFLAGDAACVVDPACSHGVLRAVMSGILAAHHTALVVGGNSSPRQGEDDYIRWLIAWFRADCSALLNLYSGFSAKPAWLDSASEKLRIMER